MTKADEREFKRPDYTYRVTVDRVIDGDTIDVLIDVGFKTIVFKRLRLLGVDTNEIRSSDTRKRERANEAKQFVQDSLDVADRVYVQTIMDANGKYGRLLAYVWIEQGTNLYNLNAQLIANGYDKADFV